MLKEVGIPDPERRARSYPHELSGGMAQRVMIAMALAAGPDLLIADEPTTALDVTIQAQILDLIRRLNRDLGMGVILITHDLGVVAEMADRVAVMYAGEIVEQAEVRPLFRDPKHPYTKGLIGSIPTLGRGQGGIGHDSRSGSLLDGSSSRLPVRLPLQGPDRTRPRDLPRGATRVADRWERATWSAAGSITMKTERLKPEAETLRPDSCETETPDARRQTPDDET